MKANKLLGDPKEVRAILKRLGLKEGDKPATLPRDLFEITEGQDTILELNENFRKNLFGPPLVRSQAYIELGIKYFSQLVENFYLTTEGNYKKFPLQGYGNGTIEAIGWAEILVSDGILMYLDEFRYGELRTLSSGQVTLPQFAPGKTIHYWIENEGFKGDIQGFLEAKKEFCEKQGNWKNKEEFFLSSFIEAVQKTEDMLKEESWQAGFLFPNPDITYPGYDGYSLFCPLFLHVGQIGRAINKGEAYWLKLTNKEKEK